ncbi:autotransporter outer membrane beta-barrel domain-containing protein [Dryocola sp. BD613]|uniref:autotransporter outer membrane beta-barrel domain-containing protein n=1 Tax=Dryocola sp. BD613 TaxID=3133272 RepID=UPI003F4FBA2B
MSRQDTAVYYQLAAGLYLLSIPVTSAIAFQAIDGETVTVTQNYASSGYGDYPLYVSGAMSKIETGADGLLFTSNSLTGVALIEKGGRLNVSNATLASEGSAADAIKLDSGVLHAMQGSISTTGTASWGIAGENRSLIALEGTTINAANSANGGIMLGSLSELEATDIQIIATDKAMGLSLKSGALADKGSAVISNSTIFAQDADAIRIMNGDIVLNDSIVSSAGVYAYAINANAGAGVTINGGRYQTTGDFGDAIWIASDDSSLTAKDAIFITSGDEAFAVNAQNGPASLSNSRLETFGANAYALYGEQTISGKQLDIQTAGAGSAGVFAARGGEIALADTTVTTAGRGSFGLIAYPGSTITGSNLQVTTTGDNAYAAGLFHGTLNLVDSALNTTGKSTAIYAAGNLDAMPNVISLDTVSIHAKQGAIVTSNAALLNMDVVSTTLDSGAGQLLDVRSNQDTSGPLFSSVNLNATKNSVLNGSLISDSVDNYTRVSLSQNSSLTGFSHRISELSLDSSSRWTMAADSDVKSLTNHGTIVFAAPDDGGYKTLSVEGDYLSDGGRLVMNTVLGDDQSATDKLTVTGDVKAGETLVTINNIGGVGAKTIEGIELVSVGGTSFGSFTSTGRIVAGSYDYSLVKKNENWFLTSQAPVIEPPSDEVIEPSPGEIIAPPSDEVIESSPGEIIAPPSDEVIESSPGEIIAPPSDEKESPDAGPVRPRTDVYRPESGALLANMMAANTMFNTTLHDRMGEAAFITRSAGSNRADGLWLRQAGGHTRFNDGSLQLKTRANRYVVQLGKDFIDWSSNDNERWHAGPMVGYGHSQSNTRSAISGYRAEGTVEGYSLGGYATWFASQEDKSGTYLDGWILYNWFKNSISGQALPQESYHSQGFTASVEGGYALPVAASKRQSSWLQPKFQLIWMDVNANPHRESNGTRISEPSSGNLLSRLGVRASLRGHSALDDNTGREFQPFIEANWIHNTSDYKVKMDDVSNTVAGTRNMAEFKTGVEGKVQENLDIWGNVTLQVGDKSFSDTSFLFGARYSF